MVQAAVPVIDVSPFVLGTSRDKADVARQVNLACVETGFSRSPAMAFPRL